MCGYIYNEEEEKCALCSNATNTTYTLIKKKLRSKGRVFLINFHYFHETSSEKNDDIFAQLSLVSNLRPNPCTLCPDLMK